MTKFQKNLTLFVLLILLSLAGSVFFAGYDSLNQPIETVSSSILPAESLTEVYNPQEIDFSIFAPFFYWKKGDTDQLVLAQYTKNSDGIVYDSIKKTPSLQSGSVSPKGDNIALQVDDTIGIFSTETQKTKTFRADAVYKNTGDHNLGSWSADGRFFYFLYSSDIESDHNYWVIDIENENLKKVLSGYDVHILGWADDYRLTYYIFPRNNESELDIFTIDVRDKSKKKVGFCDTLWLNRCLRAEYSFSEDYILFPESPNTTLNYAYNYKDQSGISLNTIMSDEQYAISHIRGFSPNKRYMYFYLFQNDTNKQPGKSGMYKYNLFGDYSRQISQDDYAFIMWDKISGSNVLLKSIGKGKDEYFIHNTESNDIHPVEIPAKILEFIY